MSNLFRTAAPDFDHPLAMLAACHGRIIDQCDTLERLVHHIADHGVDEQARQAAAHVMRYFDTAGMLHHDDEEQDVFPRLLAVADAQTLVDRLLADHESMRTAWQHLRTRLERIAAGQPGELTDEAVAAFRSLYGGHIEREERDLLPLVERVCPEHALREAGAAMAARRGVKR